MLAIEIKNLVKTYGTKVKALKGINLEIKQGDFFALLGSNGAGKTTTIGILTGLVNKTSGSVKVFGYDLETQLNKVKEQIGVVPQEFNFGMFEKIIDIVVNQAGFYGISKEVATPIANEMLDKLGLSDKKNEQAKNLSGGMKRRLMIARSMIHKPKLLILDEPTAGVDVELRHGMWEYLKELNASGTTILLTTHYLEEVEQLCKNAAIIKDGKIIKNDTVKNLLRALDSEMYVLDVNNVSKLPVIKDFKINLVDSHTLEIEIKRNQNINNLIAELTKNNINVVGIRPKGNRLEELFLNILSDK
jgi:ABC-2 type transport system ATP-binding protein